MKYILSVAILALASISPAVNALPGAYSSSYATSYPETPVLPSVPSVEFPCGYEEKNWVIEAGFGNPPQSASLLVDSTFGAIFVAGVMCHSEFCESRSSPLYHAGKSSTSVNLHQKKVFDLGDERIVKGDLYTDDFTAGSLELHSQTFGKAFSVEGFPPHPNFVGVFGLNPMVDVSPFESDYTYKATYNNTPGSYILDKRAIEGSPSNKSTGTYKPNSRPPGKKRSNTGEVCSLTFGIDYSLVYKIGWLSLPTCEFGKSPFWKTDLDCVKINGAVDLKFTNTIAEFDTTVKDIHVPLGDLKKIHQGLKATFNSHVNKYVFKCCNARDLEISFKDLKVTLPVEDWTIKVDHLGDNCAAKITVSDTIETPVSRWRLGTDFMENFYTIFDYDHSRTGLGLLHGQSPSYLS